MKHWLIVYDRSSHRRLVCDEYDDSQLAIRHRFDWERFFAGLDVEVIVLGSDSLDQIKATHGRYFQNAGTVDVLHWPGSVPREQ